MFCKQIGFLLSQQKFCNRPLSEQVTSCIRASYSSCFKNNKVEKDTNPRSDSSHCLKRDFWVFFIVCFFNIHDIEDSTDKVEHVKEIYDRLAKVTHLYDKACNPIVCLFITPFVCV